MSWKELKQIQTGDLQIWLKRDEVQMKCCDHKRSAPKVDREKHKQL